MPLPDELRNEARAAADTDSEPEARPEEPDSEAVEPTIPEGAAPATAEEAEPIEPEAFEAPVLEEAEEDAEAVDSGEVGLPSEPETPEPAVLEATPSPVPPEVEADTEPGTPDEAIAGEDAHEEEPETPAPSPAESPILASVSEPSTLTGSAIPGEAPLTAWSNVYASLIGQSILGCRIISQLGQGAMGAVYLAEQLSLERQVAIKTIKPELCSNTDLLERFRREAKYVGKFSTPHVVQIYEVGHDQGVDAILMEYVPGGSLKDFCDKQPGGRLSVADAVRFLTQTCEAMVEAENLGIVHRDLKPENLLLDASGRIKVADFGISKHLEASEQLTAATGFLGTPMYMSPEQCTGMEIDHRSDLYSLGATFSHLMTGEPPFADTNPYTVLKKKLETPRFSPARLEGGENIPERLNAVIEKMTALKREDRYASFQELLDDLKTISVSEVEVGRVRKPKSSPVLKWVTTMFVVAVVVVGGWFVAKQYTGKPPVKHQPVKAGGKTGGKTGGKKEPVQPKVVDAFPIAPLQEKFDSLVARLGNEENLDDSLREEVVALRNEVEPDVGRDERVKSMHRELARIEEDLTRYGANAKKFAALKEPRYAPPFGGIGSYWVRVAELFDADQYGSAVVQERVRSDLTRRIETLTRKIKQAVAPVLAVDDILKEREKGIFNASSISKKVKELEEARSTLRREFPGVGALARVHDAISADDVLELKSRFELFASEEIAVTQRRTEVQDSGSKIDWQVPYPNLVEKITGIREALAPPKGSGDWLKERLSELEKETIDPLASDAERNFHGACDRVREESSGTSPKAFQSSVEKLTKARAALETSFPERRELWRRLCPDGMLEGLTRKVAANASVAESLAALRPEIEALKAKFSPQPTLDQWRRAVSASVRKKTEDLEKTLGELKSRYADAPPAELTQMATALAEVRKKARAWDGHVETLAGGVKALNQRHDLKATRAAAAKIRSAGVTDPVLEDLEHAANRLQQGFDALFTELKPEEARAAFEESSTWLQKAGYSSAYVKQCLSRLKALEAIVESMAAVHGGKVRRPDAESTVEVDGFFIDCQEVSVRRFKAFLSFLEENPRFDAEMRRLWDIDEARDYSMGAEDRWRVYRNGHAHYQERLDGDLPAEYVNYFQAKAFLLREGKDLPTFDEWVLAAKGKYPHRRFTWTSDKKPRLRRVDPEDLYYGKKSGATRVSAGGLVLSLHPAVHHLAGNVAEWTRLDAGAKEARLVGGSYLQSDERYYSGERYIEKSPAEYPQGGGFRGVLRPRQFFGGLAPK